MGDWGKVKFSEIAFFQEGPGLTSNMFTDDGFPFMNIRCIENGRIKRENCQYVSNELANKKYKHFQIDENDLIVSTSGTLGKKAFVRKGDLPLLLNTSIIRFRPLDFERLTRPFLNYILESHAFLSQLTNESTGSAQVNVGPTHIKKLFVRIPLDINEQTTIATILTTIDQSIEKTEQLIAKYERIKTGLMQDLLTRGIDEQGNIRSEETHEFKDSPLGRIPKEWEVINIGSISEHIGSGVTPRGGSAVYQSSGIMLIRSQNVYPYGFKLDDVAYISEDINNTMQRSEFYENDVLLNITGASIGRCTYVPKGFPRANVNQHVCVIRLIGKNLAKAVFLSEFFNSESGQNQIFKYNAGSNREGLNYSQIRGIELCLPKEDDEFERISNTLIAYSDSLKLLENECKKYSALKAALMQDLLTGKVRVDALMNQVTQTI